MLTFYNRKEEEKCHEIEENNKSISGSQIISWSFHGNPLNAQDSYQWKLYE